tara:strand:- start:417 stop:1451 length:1035 start_codon:yes stop_codon:yes gene_type:complete
MPLKICIFLLISFFVNTTNAQLKKVLKFSTFYVAANGGTSLANQDVYSLDGSKLMYDTIITPYDYSLSMGIRKIQRFQYEGTSQFKDGTENSFSDAANIGRNPFEYLFEIDYRRQEGVEYLDQHHFLRYVKDLWFTKAEYVKEGFADIKYFESTQRFRLKAGKKLSFNFGAVQRLAEPYGYDPLEDWLIASGEIHYTCLAIEEGYSIDVYNSEYRNPEGGIVANNATVWNEVVMPQVLKDYVERKKNALDNQWQHSLVVGFDFYHYKKNFWLHSWGNLMPYHYDGGNDYSYHKYEGSQWLDYSGGLIFGYKINKHLGIFTEGKYNKYWNKEWYDFKFGINYVIF